MRGFLKRKWFWIPCIEDGGGWLSFFHVKMYLFTNCSRAACTVLGVKLCCDGMRSNGLREAPVRNVVSLVLCKTTEPLALAICM